MLFVSSQVNAGVCRKIEGYVIGFDEKTITFQVLFKKKKLTIDQALLGTEQLKFFKSRVNQLIDECVPHKSIVRLPAQSKK